MSAKVTTDSLSELLSLLGGHLSPALKHSPPVIKMGAMTAMEAPQENLREDE